MITQFNLDVLSTYRNFFLLKQMPKNMDSVVAVVQTPQGLEEVDFIDFFLMADGTSMAAWKHPFQKLGLHSVMAMSGDDYQIINMTSIERLQEMYDRPLNSSNGVFTFTDSYELPSGDWRCDRGYYGPQRFVEDVPDRAFSSNFNIVYYESVMSVPLFGHIVYLETTDKTSIGSYLIDNAVVPAWTRTLQEMFRLIYEWKVSAEEPLNNTDRISQCATGFLEHLKFSEDELELLKSLPNMQVFNYLQGDTSARVRPTPTVELTDNLASILFSRVAYSSVALMLSHNPQCGNFAEVLAREIEELDKGFVAFRNYYNVPESCQFGVDDDLIVEYAKAAQPAEEAYVKNQLRFFTNKKEILNRLENNE